MKVKIFGGHASDIEDRINRFIAKNECLIKIVDKTQSGTKYHTMIAIWYEGDIDE